MKQLILDITTCKDCPHMKDRCVIETKGKHQYWGTAYNCSKTEQRVTKDSLPENCPLPDKSNRVQLAISIMEQEVLKPNEEDVWVKISEEERK